MGESLQEEINQKKVNIAEAIDSSDIPVSQVESMINDLRETIIGLGSKAYESVSQPPETNAEPQGETMFESLDGDDLDPEFKSIEDEILSGLSQISGGTAEFDFDYDQDETITGDYETVD